MQDPRYQEFLTLLKNEGSDDSPCVYQGFIISRLVKGLSSADKALREGVSRLLNGGEPLPGSLIAMITDLAVDAEEDLKKGRLSFLLPEGSKAQLEALGALAYGLTLGLPFKADGSTDQNPELMDLVMTLNDISRVDDEGEFSTEDFKLILDFIKEQLTSLYKKSRAQP